MTDLAGRLRIHLHRRSEGLAVTIASSRLLGASRVFIGKGPAETARALPSLFSVCATAQGVACASACEIALGQTPSATLIGARRLLVDVETAREHLWRLLLDWPTFLGEMPRGPAMARVMAAWNQLNSALDAGSGLLLPGSPRPQPDLKAVSAAVTSLSDVARVQVLGQAPADWLADTPTASALYHWTQAIDTRAARLLREITNQGWSALGRAPMRALPPLTDAALEARLQEPEAGDFIARPHWAGAPAESSPLTRQLGQALISDLNQAQGNGLMTRLAVQLVELASILASLPTRLATLDEDGDDPWGQPAMGGEVPGKESCETDAQDRGEGRPSDNEAPKRLQSPASLEPILPPGVGLAQVQAARGLLVHRVALQAGRVADYCILAPTEWNFHPQGVAALGLATLPNTDDRTLLQLAGLFVTALDPCVAYDVHLD